MRDVSGNAPNLVPVYAGMKYALSAAGALVAAGLVTGCTVTVDSQGQILRDEKRFTVKGNADVRVATFDGSIQIHSWEKPDVLIEIEKRAATREAIDALDVQVEQQGNTISLEVKRPRAESFTTIGFHRTATARLIVTVPRRANVRARSGDGSISINSVNGRIELRTGDGSITARDVSGELDFSTGDGSLTVEDAEGRLKLDTGDGGVSVSGKLSSVRVHTGDGSVVYRAQTGAVMSEPWEITTGDGSVTLYLPREFGAELDAYTGDGGIRNDLEPALEREQQRERRTEQRRTLRTRLGAGGPELRIRTGDGAIRLRPS